MNHPHPDFSDPSDSQEKVEAALRRWGWMCGPEFWDRYHQDAWVFNLVNALTRTTAEVEALRVRVVADDLAPIDPALCESEATGGRYCTRPLGHDGPCDWQYDDPTPTAPWDQP